MVESLTLLCIRSRINETCNITGLLRRYASRNDKFRNYQDEINTIMKILGEYHAADP